MNRKLTNREKLMIAILAMLLIFMVYNQLLFKPVTAEMSKIQQSKNDVEDMQQVEMIKGVRLQYMKSQLAALSKNPGQITTTVPEFDNSQNMITELAAILSSATDYELSFSQVKQEGQLVRRTIGINFSCVGYEKAGQIMKQLSASRYKNRITDFSILTKVPQAQASSTTVKLPDITKDPVQVSLIVIFYELKVS